MVPGMTIIIVMVLIFFAIVEILNSMMTYPKVTMGIAFCIGAILVASSIGLMLGYH